MHCHSDQSQMDYFSTQPSILMMDYPFGYDWLYLDQQLQLEDLLLDLSPLESIHEPKLSPLSQDYDQLNDFKDIENFVHGFSSFENTISFSSTNDNCEEVVLEKKPQTNHLTPNFDQSLNNQQNEHEMFTRKKSDIIFTEASRMVGSIREIYASLDHKFGEANSSAEVNKCVGLELSDIQKHFDVPIKEAAKELGIGVTRLKKRCREVGIMRWPHRKLRSLKFLISNVKKMGMDKEDIMMLEEQKRLLEETPNLELTLKAKKLRQACFKENYKNKRAIAFARH